ncbi:hypothetical protein SAMN05519104_6654 [Rhizobiales bacterium GAS188]|nr:hypothetical protein SAMN05519104_6654 [Rhizobiales bacterium GAS188]
MTKLRAAAAAACLLTLAACNQTWGPAIDAAGTLAGTLAVPACAKVYRTAAADAKCVSTANVVITVGEAAAHGL